MADVDVGKAREATEQEGVEHEPLRPVGRCQQHEPADFRLGEVVARHEFAAEPVSGEEVRGEQVAAAGQHQNVFERDHIDPRRVLLVRGFPGDVLVESGEKPFVEFAERNVRAAAALADVGGEQPVNAPVLVIGGFAAADADHAAELLVVLPEKCQQRLLLPVVPEIHFPDQRGSDRGLPGQQRFITPFDAAADEEQFLVEFRSGGAPSRREPRADVPQGRIDVCADGQLRPLAVDRDARHDRHVAVAARRGALDVDLKSATIIQYTIKGRFMSR